VLSNPELVDIRAAQRTFEGAYIRTSLSQFSFALVVMKIFTAEFYSIGALFAVYGAGVLGVGLYRRREGNRQFFVVVRPPKNRKDRRIERRRRDEGTGEVDAAVDGADGGNMDGWEGLEGLQAEKRFRTSGNVVIVLTLLSVAAYATLLVLTLRLSEID
jgi:Domain of unknown function (DUF202)